MADVIKAIKARRSIRKYKNLQIPEDKLKTVLDAANWAPSNGNSQPWQFIVLGSGYTEAISKVFHDWAQNYIPNAAYIPEEKKPLMLEYAKDFGGAPTQIVVTYQSDGDVIKSEEALMASCAAIQNLCLAATEVGLGTVWIAGHIAHSEETRSALNLSQDRKIAGIIPIGFPDVNPPAPPRKDPELQNIVKWLSSDD